MPIEEVLLNPSCKYENVGDDDDESAVSSRELYMTIGENSETSEATENHDVKRRRICRASNESVAKCTTNTRLPRYFKDIIRMTKKPIVDTPPCQIDDLFVIEMPKIETAGYHFTCKICLRKFLYPLKLASHLLTHKDIQYSCNHCSFTVCRFIETITEIEKRIFFPSLKACNDEDSILEHIRWNHPAVDRHDFMMEVSDKLANTCFRCGYHNNTIGLPCSHQNAISKGTQKFQCKVLSE